MKIRIFFSTYIVSADVSRNKYFDPINEPQEPAYDIENFRVNDHYSLEIEDLPGVEDELIDAFRYAENRALCHYEDTTA